MSLTELGELLREERERQGLTHDDVMRRTKISRRTLEALEGGDPERLPHPVYVRGFIKAYADLLGLDSAACSEAAADCIGADPEEGLEGTASLYGENSLGEVRPVSRRSGRRIVFVAVLVIIALAAAGVWYLTQSQQGRTLLGLTASQETVEQTESLPAPEAAEETAPAVGSADDAAGPQSGSAVTEQGVESQGMEGVSEEVSENASAVTAGGDSPTDSVDVAVSEDAAAEQAEGEAVAEAAEDTQDAVAAEMAAAPVDGHVLAITATEECWVQSDADGGTTRDFLLRRGESVTLEFSEELEVRFGNAGGVKLVFDGAEFPVDAKSGQVRTLTFPPQR